jgi:hypothetical protein
MRRTCRQSLRMSRSKRLATWQELFSHVRLVTDPSKLAQLSAQAEKRGPKEEADQGPVGLVCP